MQISTYCRCCLVALGRQIEDIDTLSSVMYTKPSTTIDIMDPTSPECTFTTEYTWCVPTYVVILPKITGGISAICSAYLAKLMISEKKQTPYHRLLLNMSIADIISSTFVHVIGSWMMPRGTSPLSSGNLVTCDVQGFFGQILLITMPYLNASLTTY